MIKLIIFDWDDVFTKGSTEGYYKCYHEALLSVGINLSPEEEIKRIKPNWGSTVDKVIAGLLKDNPELQDEIVSKYDEILFGETFVNSLSIVEGAPELVRRLEGNYKLAIATGVNPQLLTEKIMPKFGIPQIFTQIESVYNVPNPDMGKPHPYMVEQILAEQKIKPEEAVLVCDAENDVLMARAAGIKPIVVLTGHLKDAEAKALGVEHIIPDITHVEGVLSNMNSIESEHNGNQERQS